MLFIYFLFLLFVFVVFYLNLHDDFHLNTVSNIRFLLYPSYKNHLSEEMLLLFVLFFCLFFCFVLFLFCFLSSAISRFEDNPVIPKQFAVKIDICALNLLKSCQNRRCRHDITDKKLDGDSQGRGRNDR